MTRDRQDNPDALQEEIRRQFGSTGTARFLHALPAFQVERGMPERFRNLLSELERSESDRRNSGMNGHGG